jgi:predicted small metal-binding protein
MPDKIIHCSKCGQSIKGYDLAERMDKLRRHYKKHHPVAFRESFKKRNH